MLRSRHLVAFYTDTGVLPRSTLRVVFGSYHLLTGHDLWGTETMQALLFVVAALAAVALILGYRTRVATLLSLLLLVSIQARNPIVLNGGDTLLRRLLFWSLFLPLGERLAVDATESEPRSAVSGVATVGLLGQVLAVYVVNAVIKLRGDAWPSGRALSLVLDLDQFTVFAGDALAEIPILHPVATWLWLGVLVVSPLLVVLTGRKRAIIVGLFLASHAGMAMLLSLGIFPLVSIAALLPFLPAVVWDRFFPNRWSATSTAGERLTGRQARATNNGDSPRWRLRQAGLSAVLLLLLLSNASTLGIVSADDSPVPEQSWDMFAPSPPLTDGWFVAPGRTTTNRTVDALADRSLRWDRPPDLVAAYPSARWRKYLMSVRASDDRRLRQSLAQSLCGRWNRSHESDLRHVRLVFVAEQTRLDGPDQRRRESLGRYDCPRTERKDNSRVPSRRPPSHDQVAPERPAA